MKKLLLYSELYDELCSRLKEAEVFENVIDLSKFRTPYPQEIKVTPSKGHFPSISGFGVRKTFHKNI